MNKSSNSFIAAIFLGCLLVCMSGCVGTIIETATDATLAVAKAPFKVGGAIVDVVSGDEDD